MGFRVMVNPYISKKITEMNEEQKVDFVSTVNLLQVIGQMGFPIIREFNVWRCRAGDIRIIYAIKDNIITILNVFIGINAT